MLDGGAIPPISTRLHAVRYFVYIIKCEKDKLYTGISKNPEERFKVHQQGKGAKFTKAFKPIAMVYKKRFNSHKKASQTEHRIKQLSKEDKLLLIKNFKSKK